MTARARHLAATLRAQHEIERPPTPDGLVFLHSQLIHEVIHIRLTTLPNSIGGALYRGKAKGGDDGAVIWLDERHLVARRRFSLFHEYGHFLMHEGIFYCQGRNWRTTVTEREADVFAVEMLMPKLWLLRDAAEIGVNPWALAKRYSVSQKAMQIRLHELGLSEMGRGTERQSPDW